jgi:hypothetical protein
VAGLFLMIVLVVVAFLVKPTATDRKFRLPGLLVPRRTCGARPSAGKVVIRLPRIRDIRLSFEYAELLLVRLTALQRCTRTALALASGTLSPVIYFSLVDTSHRIGVVLDVTLKGVFAGKLFKILRRHLRHCNSL